MRDPIMCCGKNNFCSARRISQVVRAPIVQREAGGGTRSKRSRRRLAGICPRSNSCIVGRHVTMTDRVERYMEAKALWPRVEVRLSSRATNRTVPRADMIGRHVP